jgi:hypothetical protein
VSTCKLLQAFQAPSGPAFATPEAVVHLQHIHAVTQKICEAKAVGSGLIS